MGTRIVAGAGDWRVVADYRECVRGTVTSSRWLVLLVLMLGKLLSRSWTQRDVSEDMYVMF